MIPSLRYLDYLDMSPKYRENPVKFGFFLQNPNNLLNNLSVNDLLKLYIGQNLEVNAALKSQDYKYQSFIEFEGQEVVNLALFKGDALYRLLFVAFVRTSFHEQAKSPVLYEITFSTIEGVLPELRVFRRVDNALRFTHSTYMNKVSENEGVAVYDCLLDSPVAIELTLIRTASQSAVRIVDRSKNELFSVTSAHLIEDPVLRLKGYFECLAQCQGFKTLIKSLEIYLADLVEEIEMDEAAVRTIIADPSMLHSILESFYWVYKNNLPLKTKHFFKKAIVAGFTTAGNSSTVEFSESINEDTFAFLHSNRIDIVKRIEKIDQETIQEVIEDLQLLKVKYPTAVKNSIEFIVCEELDTKVDCHAIFNMLMKYPNSDLDLEEIIFTFEKDSRLHYNTYKFDHKGIPHPCLHLHHTHPAYYKYFELHRFDRFELSQEFAAVSPASFLFFAAAKKISGQAGKIKDERLIGLSSITQAGIEEALQKLLTNMKIALDTRQKEKTPFYNRMIFHINSPLICSKEEFSQVIETLIEKYWLSLQEVNIDKVLVRFTSDDTPFVLEVKNVLSSHLEFVINPVHDTDNTELVRIASSTEQRELQQLSKGAVWAYRVPAFITALADEFRKKELGMKEIGQKLWQQSEQSFIELDLDHSKTVIDRKTGSIDYNYGELIEVSRPLGNNEAGIIVGIKIDDLGIGKPITRLLIIGDLTHSSRGAIRAQECARVNAAIRYAARHKIPIDWFAASYGVQVHREKGVEGLDAAASTIREIVVNCHHKGVQINLVIDETNIGAQSYWDSMATILNETSGILIMTPKGCMALTGPSALVSALYRTAHSEELPQFTKNLYPKGLQSLAGYEAVHGPNSDSMLFAKTFKEACYLLLKHHYFSYIDSSEKLASYRPQRLGVDESGEVSNIDAVHKEIDNFLKGLKPDREVILDYIMDKDAPEALQFWSDIKGIQRQTFKNGDLPQAPSTIVKEMLIGGFPTLVIFTATGPLTPVDAEIIARGIYKASGRMQVLIIGSLSGFSCDPLSMENRQLQAGSYIAKAIVDHDGPLLIVNLGNLVGGTFVVFNKQLNPDLRILAIEGARVQVLGGKAAAKVVFHSQICKRADEDPRVLQAVLQSVKTAPKSPKDDVIQKISNEKMGEIKETYTAVRNQVIIELEDKEAEAFDQYHNAQRAVKVGSIDQIISFENLRGSIILAFEEMRAKYLKKVA